MRRTAIVVGLMIAVPVAASVVCLFMMLWHLFGPKDKDGNPWAPKSELVTKLLIIGATALISWFLLTRFIT